MIEVLHGVLHGVLGDKAGGVGSVFAGGSGDRICRRDVCPERSIEGPSTLAVEGRVSLS